MDEPHRWELLLNNVRGFIRRAVHDGDVKCMGRVLVDQSLETETYCFLRVVARYDDRHEGITTEIILHRLPLTKNRRTKTPLRSDTSAIQSQKATATFCRRSPASLLPASIEQRASTQPEPDSELAKFRQEIQDHFLACEQRPTSCPGLPDMKRHWTIRCGSSESLVFPDRKANVRWRCLTSN